MVPDVLAVMDAVGMERAALVGWTDAAAIAMTVAAMHPQRVSALVLGEVLATSTPDEDHPWGPNPDTFKTVAGVIEQGMWGQAILLSLIAPSVTAPALLLHRKDAPFIPAEGMRWLAEHLPNGQYAEVPGDETPGYLGDVDGLMDEVEEFLFGTRVGSAVDRRVATVLFSDVVGSTERAATVGDRAWSGLLEAHRVEARRLFARHGGRESSPQVPVSPPSPHPERLSYRRLCETWSSAPGSSSAPGAGTSSKVCPGNGTSTGSWCDRGGRFP